MMKYKIISSERPSCDNKGFEAQVEGLVSDGWTISGGVSAVMVRTGSLQYSQAFVKEEVPEVR